MSKEKVTDASAVEVTDEAMDGAQGGAGYIKFDGIDGESKLTSRTDLRWKVEEGEAFVDAASPYLRSK